MKMIRTFTFIYRAWIQHRLNRNGNFLKFKNKTLPFSSQIDCENGAKYKIEGLILRDRCSVRVRKGGNLNIGDNCVVGAGSVVRGEYHSNTLIVGNPAVEKKVI